MEKIPYQIRLIALSPFAFEFERLLRRKGVFKRFCERIAISHPNVTRFQHYANLIEYPEMYLMTAFEWDTDTDIDWGAIDFEWTIKVNRIYELLIKN